MNPTATLDAQAIVARRIALAGRVQGVGLRPRIARLAAERGLKGLVRNTSAGVEIEAEGPLEAIERFLIEVRHALGDGACLAETTDLAPGGRGGFTIEPSQPAGPLAAPVPPDLAACPECLREASDRLDRRHAYPLSSCTSCGPRYSVIWTMPYDRTTTAMAGFPLCAACAREYGSPSDRRFHAQSIACPACGPQVWAAQPTGRLTAEKREAIRAAVACLRAGGIVALRGVGGYQLLCDAARSPVVARLRERKRRPVKPLAVMVESPAAAQRSAVLSSVERAQLCSPAGPIVTVRARAGSGLAPEIHPGLDEVGLMLPTTPLHFLLACEFGGPLVCTSGNREGEPLAVGVAEAEERLGDVADLLLHHDRPIERPIDDSVVRVIAGRPVTLRLGRGLAPLPLGLPTSRPFVALGGQQKAAIAVSNGAQAALGPHVGDLDTLATFERYQAQLESLADLYRMPPAWPVAADRHPDYAARRWAEARSWPLVEVQHHHAHVAAGMLEHGWLDREVLGVAFDGAGYGPDGTIWGGEFLRTTLGGYERVARLRPFALVGGEAAIREPWRVALVMLGEALGAEHPLCRRLSEAAHGPPDVFWRAAANPALAPRSSSVGRLFDAVAALALVCRASAYEGRPAMLLEAVCDASADGAYELPLCRHGAGGPAELDWRPLIRGVAQDFARGVATGTIAMRFHRGLAAAVATVARAWPELPVVFAGGVFQNRVLTELVAGLLADRELALPGVIPPGDGGLAAGQLAVALAVRTNNSI